MFSWAAIFFFISVLSAPGVSEILFCVLFVVFVATLMVAFMSRPRRARLYHLSRVRKNRRIRREVNLILVPPAVAEQRPPRTIQGPVLEPNLGSSAVS